jgi:hypothetical protein
LLRIVSYSYSITFRNSNLRNSNHGNSSNKNSHTYASWTNFNNTNKNSNAKTNFTLIDLANLNPQTNKLPNVYAVGLR